MCNMKYNEIYHLLIWFAISTLTLEIHLCLRVLGIDKRVDITCIVVDLGRVLH